MYSLCWNDFFKFCKCCKSASKNYRLDITKLWLEWKNKDKTEEIVSLGNFKAGSVESLRHPKFQSPYLRTAFWVRFIEARESVASATGNIPTLLVLNQTLEGAAPRIYAVPRGLFIHLSSFAERRIPHSELLSLSLFLFEPTPPPRPSIRLALCFFLFYICIILSGSLTHARCSPAHKCRPSVRCNDRTDRDRTHTCVRVVRWIRTREKGKAFPPRDSPTTGSPNPPVYTLLHTEKSGAKWDGNSGCIDAANWGIQKPYVWVYIRKSGTKWDTRRKLDSAANVDSWENLYSGTKNGTVGQSRIARQKWDS